MWNRQDSLMQQTAALPRIVYALWFGALFSIFGTSVGFAENWPQWRGMNGDGVSHEKSLPIAWSETTNIIWKVPLPEWGDSTPAIWNDAIFVTTQVGEELKLLRLAKSTGQIEWTQT